MVYRLSALAISREQTLLADARLISGRKQHGLPTRIECKGHSPNPIRSLEANLLQVGVLGAFSVST